MITKNKKAITWRGWPQVRRRAPEPAPGPAAREFLLGVVVLFASALIWHRVWHWSIPQVKAAEHAFCRHPPAAAVRQATPLDRLPFPLLARRAWAAAARSACGRSGAKRWNDWKPSGSCCRCVGAGCQPPLRGRAAGRLGQQQTFATPLAASRRTPLSSGSLTPRPSPPPWHPVPAPQDALHKANCLCNLVLRNHDAPAPAIEAMQVGRASTGRERLRVASWSPGMSRAAPLRCPCAFTQASWAPPSNSHVPPAARPPSASPSLPLDSLQDAGLPVPNPLMLPFMLVRVSPCQLAQPTGARRAAALLCSSSSTAPAPGCPQHPAPPAALPMAAPPPPHTHPPTPPHPHPPPHTQSPPPRHVLPCPGQADADAVVEIEISADQLNAHIDFQQ